jgi:hypothetical protein
MRSKDFAAGFLFHISSGGTRKCILELFQISQGAVHADPGDGVYIGGGLGAFILGIGHGTPHLRKGIEKSHAHLTRR